MYKKIGKRVIDIIISFGSLIILSPLMLLLSLLIKLTEPGSIFFKQLRVGKNGRIFTLYKLRSMPISTENIPSDKVGEVRIRFVGRIIRRTNIDELPQLLNVLIGDMSIVGPRPPMLNQIELIDMRKKNGSIQCLPGLTGLAQVNSYDGMSVKEKAAFDGKYAHSISFIIDVKIFYRTFSYLFRTPPVY